MGSQRVRQDYSDLANIGDLKVHSTKEHMPSSIEWVEVMYGYENWTVSAKELMLLNCGVGEDSEESLGLQGAPTSQSKRKSILNWKD